MAKFYRLTVTALEELLRQLSPTQTVVLLWLKAKNPFADSYRKVTTNEIAHCLNISQRTVQRSLKKLRELQLIDYRMTELEYCVTEVTQERQKCRHEVKGDASTTLVSPEMTEMSLPQAETITVSEVQSPLDHKTIQTCVEEDKRITKGELRITNDKRITNDELTISNSLPQGWSRTHYPSFAQVAIWSWLPEGDWNQQGKLDPAFHDWLARRWVAKYQDCDIHESRANVLSHFRNDPAKLPIKWQQYQEETLARTQNVKERLDNGFIIPPQEQADMVNRLVGGQWSAEDKEEEIPVNPTALKKITEFLQGMRYEKN